MSPTMRWFVASIILASIMTILAAIGILGFWYTGSIISAFGMYLVLSMLGTAFLFG